MLFTIMTTSYQTTCIVSKGTSIKGTRQCKPTQSSSFALRQWQDLTNDQILTEQVCIVNFQLVINLKNAIILFWFSLVFLLTSRIMNFWIHFGCCSIFFTIYEFFKRGDLADSARSSFTSFAFIDHHSWFLSFPFIHTKNTRKKFNSAKSGRICQIASRAKLDYLYLIKC